MFTRNGQSVGSIQVDPAVSNPVQRKIKATKAAEAKVEDVEVVTPEPTNSEAPVDHAVGDEPTPEPAPKPEPTPAAPLKPQPKPVFGSALNPKG